MAICPSCLATYPGDVTSCPADGTALVPDDTLQAAVLELESGRTVGEYRIDRKIGEGGFGAVYSATHPVIGKSAAIKVLNPQFSANPTMVSRFISEARAVNQIRHRGIIDIFSFGKLDDGRQYYIMELLEGMTLEAYLRQRGRLKVAEALPILRQIARALDAAHAAGIAHRDLKPENVFLVFDDDGAIFPKLLDFGIAKLLGDSQSHNTRTGTPMGTPLYMSPEQCRGKQVDHRTDIYSFGVMTHIVLTGQPPFQGEDVMDVLMQQVQATPPTLSSVCPDVPSVLDGAVLSMLAKAPAERPATVTAAIDALIEAARSGGIDVPAVATRSSEELPRVNLPRALTPEQAVFAQADTMVQPDATATTGAPRTLPAAGETPSGHSKFIGFAVGAGLFVAGIAVTLFYTSRHGSPVASPAAMSPPPPMATATATATATAEAPPEPMVVPTAPLEVEIRVQSTPEEVEVYLGERRLGAAPGPLKLPRGKEAVELTFSARGHQSKTVSVEPTNDLLIPITLEEEKKDKVPPSAVAPRSTTKAGGGSAPATTATSGNTRDKLEY